MNPTSESKKLAIELRANEECYVTGQLNLNESLDKTEQLFNELQIKTSSEDGKICANEIMPDSCLLQLQARLAKKSAKFYKPDSLVFNATDFSVKLKLYYDQSSSISQSTQSSASQKGGDMLWFEMGNEAKRLLYTVPTFNFIHGTFDPNPVEVIKKKRRMKEKEKIGDLTKPQSMSLTENDGKDGSVKRAEEVLGVLQQLLRKQEMVCLYEFVTDPSSFGRTIENLFILSLLVNQNCVRIVEDRNELPFLVLVDEDEKRERNPAATKQSILSISKEEWKDIVKTFKFKNALIPPQRHSKS